MNPNLLELCVCIRGKEWVAAEEVPILKFWPFIFSFNAHLRSAPRVKTTA